MAFRFSLCPVLRIWADTFVPWTRKQVNKNSRSTPFPRPAPLPQREEETIIWTPPLISASLLLFPLSYSLLSFPSLFLPAIKSSNNHDWYRLKCCFKSRTKRDVNIDFYPILDREPQPHHPRFVPPTPARVSCQRWHGLAWKIHKRENQGGGRGWNWDNSWEILKTTPKRNIWVIMIRFTGLGASVLNMIANAL